MLEKIAVGRVAIAMLITSSILLGSIGAIGTVAAQDCDMSSPEGMSNCDKSDFDRDDLSYEIVWNNLYTLAQTTLQYAGYVVVFAGVTLWFGTTDSSDRAQIGMWLTFSGLAMIALYFGYSTVIEMIRYVATGGG